MTETAGSKPRTFHGDLAALPTALLPLTKLKRWMIWKWEKRKSKGKERWTKTPYHPVYYNEHAKSNDVNTWGTYPEAVLAFTQQHCDGIGFMLLDSDLGAVDLDHIRDLVSGHVLPWAETLFSEAAAAGCYVEWTVSGTGARIIGIAKGGQLHRKINVNRKTDCSVEFYRHCERYITISGMQVNGEYPGLPVNNKLAEYDAFFDALFARFCDDAQKPTESESEFVCDVVGTLAAIEDGDGAPEVHDAPSMFDFNDVGPQRANVDYEKLIEDGAQEGGRSEEFQRVVWRLAANGMTPEDIVKKLEAHPSGIAEKYVGRLTREVQRSYEKWLRERHAKAIGASSSITSISSASSSSAGRSNPSANSSATSSSGTATSGASSSASASAPSATTFFLPHQIRVVAGELQRVVAEAENALLAYGCNLYQRGGRVVIPVEMKYAASDDREDRGWQLIEVSKHELIHVLSGAARFWKYDARMKRWKVIDPPENVADTYLARRGRWKLPVLTGVVHTPFLRRDGSICETPGYDAASGLMFKPEGELFPPIPQQPTKADAEKALAKLVNLISTFPFVSEADRSVALSAMLTTLDRRSVQNAPLHGFTAPVAGTGKSLLVDICSILATGRLMPVISPGRDEGELEKRLGAALLAGNTAISFDNCEHVLGGTLLNQALTQRQVDIRVLGKSRIDTTPTNNVTLFATGSNLVFGNDITRRVLRCALDAKCERPELREFNVEADDLARQQRVELVVAALTVLRAYHVANEPVKLRPWGSFKPWSRRIRAPLVWLGRADPYDTADEVRKNDPYRTQLVAVITQWEQHLRIGNRYTVQDVIAQAVNVPSFYAALMAVAGKGPTVSNERLGRWLKQVEGKMVGNLSLRSPGMISGYPTWSLMKT